MRNNLKCPLCNQKIYTGLGKGCKMCGMIIEINENFCSRICEKEYKKINKK